MDLKKTAGWLSENMALLHNTSNFKFKLPAQHNKKTITQEDKSFLNDHLNNVTLRNRSINNRSALNTINI